MVVHELFGLATAFVVGTVLVSALSSKSQTAGVITATTNGFANLLGAVSGAKN